MKTDRRNFLKVAGVLSSVALMPNIVEANSQMSNGLSAAQESAIAELWQLEKLRGDLSRSFSSTHSSEKTFGQFGTFAATNRKAVLNELVKLYRIDLSKLENSTLLYTTEQIINMGAGTFASTTLQGEYDTRKNGGSSSPKDAYLVLTKLLVDTIDKTDGYITSLFDSNKKIKDNLTYLNDGAMGHYWHIDRNLKNLGSSQGCCEAGTSYCKTQTQYPVSLGVDHSTAPQLSNEQKHALTHMWSEEKMAHDAFEIVFTVYPRLRLFYNIGHWSEVQHMTAVEELISFYNFDVLDYQNTDAYYDEAKLRALSPGQYAIQDFEDRFSNVLLPYATQPGTLEEKEKNALKLGCMVEIQDIRDLTGFLGQNTGSNYNQYIEKTFRYLVAGSQSHYWAYHYALVERGEPTGCCCAGNDYCKTPEEFPSGSGDMLLAKLWNRSDHRFEKFGRKYTYSYA
jgi:hypothetical protein